MKRTEHIGKTDMKLDDLPLFTPALVQKLLNSHLEQTDCCHGRFYCGQKLGYGSNGTVYKLYYIPSNDDGEVMSDKELAVKVVSPLHTFMKIRPELAACTYVSEVTSDPSFAPFIRSSERLLDSISWCDSNQYHLHHFLRYYPQFSFHTYEICPYSSIVVMNEVAGTLKDINLPDDLSAIIRMIIKLGREIGDALQISEGSFDGSGFMHRDLKPGNIGISINLDNPDLFEFLLIDIDSGIREDSNNSTQTIIVNEFSKAPELTEDTDPDEIDYARIDMYNLGSLMRYISRDQFDFLPDGLKRIIHKASHKNPSHRYDNGEELIDDLDKFEKEYASGISDSAVNIRRFMDEQKAEREKEKREYRAKRSILNKKLEEKTKEIHDLKIRVKELTDEKETWEKQFDSEAEQREFLQSQLERSMAAAADNKAERIALEKRAEKAEALFAETAIELELFKSVENPQNKTENESESDLLKELEIMKNKNAELQRRVDEADTLRAELEMIKAVQGM